MLVTKIHVHIIVIFCLNKGNYILNLQKLVMIIFSIEKDIETSQSSEAFPF